MLGSRGRGGAARAGERRERAAARVAQRKLAGCAQPRQRASSSLPSVLLPRAGGDDALDSLNGGAGVVSETAAVFLNASAVVCTAPAGEVPGASVAVEVTLNGADYAAARASFAPSISTAS